MTDKERLETSYVIETVKRETVIAKGVNNTRDNVNLPIDLVLVLIEQAERVQELEEHLRIANQYVKKEREINTSIKQQNKRYREAMEGTFKELKYGDTYNAEIILVDALEGEE